MIERHRVASIDQLAESTGHRIDVAGHRIALFLIGADAYAIGDRCSHAEASLAEGEVFDGAVECPRHGSEFDLRTGKPSAFPATQPVPIYVVEVEGSDVYLSVEPMTEDEA
jgi:3-phenylpropionate/trans-cinnamate dioxygenase ferredoxin subunit